MGHFGLISSQNGTLRRNLGHFARLAGHCFNSPGHLGSIPGHGVAICGTVGQLAWDICFYPGTLCCHLRDCRSVAWDICFFPGTLCCHLRDCRSVCPGHLLDMVLPFAGLSVSLPGTFAGHGVAICWTVGQFAWDFCFNSGTWFLPGTSKHFPHRMQGFKPRISVGRC